VKVGDLVRCNRHPQAGIGVVIEIGSQEDYIIAMFSVHGIAIVYADEWEVISESR